MSGKIFTNGFSMVLMSSISKRKISTVSQIQMDILEFSGKDIKQAVISGSLKGLEKKGFVVRQRGKSKIAGAVVVGQHRTCFHYKLTAGGVQNRNWMLNCFGVPTEE